MSAPQLWRVMSSTPEKCLSFHRAHSGNGINRGNEKGDYLASKDGWVGFSLKKRFETGIITQKEYNMGMRDVMKINNNIHKVKSESKRKRYLNKDRLSIPILKHPTNSLSKFDKKIKIAIDELCTIKKGLFTYKTLANHTNIYKGELVCSNSVKRLWNAHYDRSQVYYKF